MIWRLFVQWSESENLCGSKFQRSTACLEQYNFIGSKTLYQNIICTPSSRIFFLFFLMMKLVSFRYLSLSQCVGQHVSVWVYNKIKIKKILFMCVCNWPIYGLKKVFLNMVNLLDIWTFFFFFFLKAHPSKECNLNTPID